MRVCSFTSRFFINFLVKVSNSTHKKKKINSFPLHCVATTA